MKARRLRELLESDEGWGRNEGRRTCDRLLELTDLNPETTVTPVSEVSGVRLLGRGDTGNALPSLATASAPPIQRQVSDVTGIPSP